MATNLKELKVPENKVNNVKEEFELVSLLVDNAEKLYKKSRDSENNVLGISRDIGDDIEVSISAFSGIKDATEIRFSIYDKRARESAFRAEVLGTDVIFYSGVTYVPEAKKVYEKAINVIKEMLNYLGV